MATVDEVLERVRLLGGLTVTDVRGHGRQKGHTRGLRARSTRSACCRKVEIEVVVAPTAGRSHRCRACQAARTGEIGDGRVFVLPVEQAYNIRTGERNVI